MLIDPYTWHTVRIRRIVREATHAVTLVVTRPKAYSFIAGQHAIVRATIDGHSYTRQYSYASSPDETELHFTITRSPGGIVSSWAIDTAHPGDTLSVSQAFQGPLMYIASPGERIGLIAGGSGIAPLMSHIRTWQSFNRPVQTTLLYSTRSDSMCYRQELQDLTNTAVHVRETDTEPRFDVESIKNSLSHQSIILICGSRDFVRDMRSVCVEIFPSTPVKAEAFTIDRFDEIHEP